MSDDPLSVPGGLVDAAPAQRICGWCRREIAPGAQPATFGICAKCFVRLESEPKRPTTKGGWAALGAASDAVQAEFADWQQDNTPTTTRAKLGSAIREFCAYLGPVIGNEAAFRYQASWQAFEDALDRNAQLTATMAAQPTIDAGDAALMRHLRRELDVAREAFEHVQTATQAALDEAKKGGS